jgi:diguanylate cyclase (GGDEF)-like protein/PAS domain S-box-containing protein
VRDDIVAWEIDLTTGVLSAEPPAPAPLATALRHAVPAQVPGPIDLEMDGFRVVGRVATGRASGVAVPSRDEVYRLTVETSSDAFVGIDGGGRITDWNGAAEGMFGWRRSEALGQDMVALIMPARYRTAHRRGVARVKATGQFSAFAHGRREFMAVRRSGHEFPIELSVTPVQVGDELHFKAFLRDISDRRHVESQLARQALTDSLTGLPNRTLFMDRLSRAVARLDRAGQVLAVLFIDLDRFKVVNDSLGHRAGDQLLLSVAERIKGAVRPSDTVARFGGDEFVVLCEELEAGEEGGAAVAAIAERLGEALASPLLLEGRQVYPSASVGIALAASGEVDADSLVRDADAAMYLAKERGRSRYEIFDAKMRERALARLELEADLRIAIDRDELDVWYQPVISLADGRVSGLEALVRWAHPTRGRIGPSDFVGMAEECGLISGLGRRVLNRAVADVTGWRAQGWLPTEPFALSVNLSGRELCQPDLLAMVKSALAGSAPGGPTFCVEITESVLMDDTGETAAALGALRDLGLGLGVDDFGTGYSSLLYLRRFPVQLLKLDRFFIAGLTSNPEDTAIVESVIRLAHSLGLLAVAEGVETEAQMRALQAMGCDLAQGFYWSQPVPASQVLALLDPAAVHTRAAIA